MTSYVVANIGSSVFLGGSHSLSKRAGSHNFGTFKMRSQYEKKKQILHSNQATLPRKTTALEESNFFYRLLYRDILSFTFADWHFVGVNCSTFVARYHMMTFLFFWCLTVVCLFLLKNYYYYYYYYTWGKFVHGQQWMLTCDLFTVANPFLYFVYYHSAAPSESEVRYYAGFSGY